MVALVHCHSTGSPLPGPPLQYLVYPPTMGGDAFTVAASKVAPVFWANRPADAKMHNARLFIYGSSSPLSKETSANPRRLAGDGPKNPVTDGTFTCFFLQHNTDNEQLSRAKVPAKRQ